MRKRRPAMFNDKTKAILEHLEQSLEWCRRNPPDVPAEVTTELEKLVREIRTAIGTR